MGMNTIVIVNHDLIGQYTKSERSMVDDINQIITYGPFRAGAFTRIGSGNSYSKRLYLTNGNTGEPLTGLSEVDEKTLEHMRMVLEVNGYKVSKTRKIKSEVSL